MIRMAFDPGDLVERLDDALEDAAARAIDRAGELVAGAAKREHPYRDRSGDLTASIEGLKHTGSLRAGTLQGGAAAAMPYAGIVEARGYAFLQPAYDLVEDRIDQETETELERAVARALASR